ncbi:hypothetical protein ACHQM5_027017 [Ranunculus cassubicifolius]
MSFATLYNTLQELFPQVDHRVLKAVSIEHRKDADAAVEFILNEVLPSVDIPPSSPHGQVVHRDDTQLSVHSPEVPVAAFQEDGNLSSPKIIAETNLLADHEEASQKATLSVACVVEELGGSSSLNSQYGSRCDQLSLNSEAEEVSSRTWYQEDASIGSPQSSDVVSASPAHECKNVADDTVHALNVPAAYDASITNPSDGLRVAHSSEVKDTVVHIDSSNVSAEQQGHVEDSESDAISRANIEPESRVPLETVSEQMVHETKLADPEDESFSSITVTQSGQICSIDVLEDAISEAKNNKKTLFSSMESVIGMMKEVEDLEKAAEAAKKEAVKGGLDILAKVEDIRKMLLHAQAANDMHVGEVYGEKAILATEARELQSRLLNLSYERDRSLAILDEMRQSLESRLAAAEEIMKQADQDRLNKEESARKALTEQENVMDNVVQESKRLQSEAEENSKLRDFLMDRGKLVDVLQGEIGVICHDIKLLKENFDDRVPLSKSLSSSQTSCILASSGSTGRSLSLSASLGSDKDEQLESPKLLSPIIPVDNSLEKSMSEWSEGSMKKNVEDDWDLFEDETDLYNSKH